MKKKIKIILLEDIKSLGQAGQIVSVSEGYARNTLFPAGQAALATPSKQAKQAKASQAQAAARSARITELQTLAETLTGTELTIKAQIKDGDEIFGSITAKNIADELNNQTDLAIKPKQINLAKNINKLGSQDIEISLADDVPATIRVTVIPEPPDAENS